MRQPNEYWLKYMILFSGMNQEQIMQAADLYEMPPPPQAYLRQLRDKLDETRPSSIRMDSSPARVWLRAQRVMTMASNERYAVAARDMLGDNKCRPILEALLISGMSADKVSVYTKKLTGKKLARRTVELFGHYFWNRNLLSTTQWYDYLEGRRDGDLLKSCYRQGEEFALWKVGYRVEVSKDDIVRGVLHESTMRFFETGQKDNTKDTALTAKLWSESIFKSLEELGKSGDDVQQVLTELRDIAIRLGRRDISSVDNLLQGDEHDD